MMSSFSVRQKGLFISYILFGALLLMASSCSESSKVDQNESDTSSEDSSSDNIKDTADTADTSNFSTDTGSNDSDSQANLTEQWDDWEKDLVAKSYTEISSEDQLEAWYCLRMGGDVFDDTEDLSSSVKCELPDGTKCDISFFYFGTCALEQSACTQMGYELIIDNSNPSNYIVYCVTDTQEQILLFDVVEQLP